LVRYARNEHSKQNHMYRKNNKFTSLRIIYNILITNVQPP